MGKRKCWRNCSTILFGSRRVRKKYGLILQKSRVRPWSYYCTYYNHQPLGINQLDGGRLPSFFPCPTIKTLLFLLPSSQSFNFLTNVIALERPFPLPPPLLLLLSCARPSFNKQKREEEEKKNKKGQKAKKKKKAEEKKGESHDLRLNQASAASALLPEDILGGGQKTFETHITQQSNCFGTMQKKCREKMLLFMFLSN